MLNNEITKEVGKHDESMMSNHRLVNKSYDECIKEDFKGSKESAQLNFRTKYGVSD